MKNLFDSPRIREIDESTIRYAQDHLRGPLIDPFMIVYTYLGGGTIWCVWAGILCFSPETRPVGICCFVSFLVGWILASRFWKDVFGRPRSYDAMEDIKPLIRRPKDLAFPSAHAACAFSVAMVLFLTRPLPEGITALLMAVLGCYSRIHVGVHYLSDVIGGALWGSLCAVFFTWLMVWR